MMTTAEEHRKQFEEDRRTQFWIDSMLTHQRTDSAGYAIIQSNIALEEFDSKIKKSELK